MEKLAKINLIKQVSLFTELGNFIYIFFVLFTHDAHDFHTEFVHFSNYIHLEKCAKLGWKP